MSLKVITDEKNPQLWKVLVTAKYAGVSVETQLGQNANAKEFAAKSPMGKVPVLETKEGNIFEANAIARYLARVSKGQLYGSNDFQASLIDQYLDFATNDVELPGAVWIYPILGFIANNQAATSKAQADIKKALDFLNGQLSTRTFLVGERVTIADIVVAMSLFYLFQKVLDVNFRKPYTNVTRWFTTIVNQPFVKEVVGEVVLCEKAEVAPATFTPKEQPKEAPKKEEKKEEKKEVKKEAPKKKEAEPEDEEEEDLEDDTPKKPNVLDSLPKSSMIFDEWKRVYSNAKDTRGSAMPWLWEHFDKEGYSLWISDYKYNNECEKVFMTCNLIGGWIQRLDKLRKYGFGSLCIFGTEPNLEVSGAWIFRGPNIPEEMTFTDDSEHYTWRKCDPNDAATRELFNDYFSWDGTFGGTNKQFNQGKIFK